MQTIHKILKITRRSVVYNDVTAKPEAGERFMPQRLKCDVDEKLHKFTKNISK